MKLARILIALVAVVALSASGNALSWTTNVAHIYAHGGLDVLVPGAEFSSISSLTDPYGGMIDFSSPAEIRIGNSSWNPWRAGSYEPVLWTGMGVSSMTLYFDNSPTAFGMWAMPNLLNAPFDVTLGLVDGSELTQLIDGTEGPSFFGFTHGVGVSWMTVSVDEPEWGLGFGEMVMAAEYQPIPGVPEPATMTLLGLGLVGLGAGLRKRIRK